MPKKIKLGNPFFDLSFNAEDVELYCSYAFEDQTNDEPYFDICKVCNGLCNLEYDVSREIEHVLTPSSGALNLVGNVVSQPWR